VLTHLKGLKSAPQHAIAVDRACWAGEAVCAVVAKTRAQAEDACELVDVTYEPLPAVTDPETALNSKTPVIHSDLGDNLCFERKLDVGEVDKAFAASDAVVETTFMFGRHTGVTTEPRAIVADWNEGEQRNALQCGYCTPGMLTAAQDILKRGNVPSRDEIREHISGNYCRCTGYHAIVDAVEAVAKARAGATK
jgi:carbon-monoxide dehydrogenase large subunit